MSNQEPEIQQGEFFVDEAQSPIPTRDTWGDMSFQQLLELKMQLEEKAWTFAKNPIISRTLTSALDDLQKMIDSRI